MESQQVKILKDEMPKEQPPITTSFQYHILTPDEQLIISTNTDWLIEARNVISEQTRGTSLWGNQAAIGQMLKLIMQKLENQKNINYGENLFLKEIIINVFWVVKSMAIDCKLIISNHFHFFLN